jgi:hypothetical protein
MLTFFSLFIAQNDQGRSYPAKFGQKGVSTDASINNALDAIPGCETNQANTNYYEFPIGDPVYTGGRPSADRVLTIAANVGQGQQRNYIYCLSMTHRFNVDDSDGSYNPCT